MLHSPGKDNMTALKPRANGTCWCGCGGEVKPGKFFVQTHDRWAEAYIIRTHYGSIAAFLEYHGYGPDGKNARREAVQTGEVSSVGEQVTEAEEDSADIAEAERRLSDPDEVPVPYEQARRSLGLP
jgi:hypothetical protein